MKTFKYYLVITLLLSFGGVTAQTNDNYSRGFDIGFKEGYCYQGSSYYCNPPMTPITPIPRINEDGNSYTDGYNRGFVLGKTLRGLKDEDVSNDVLINPPRPTFNGYVPQNPVQAMATVGMYKQRVYDSRKEWIQNRINNLTMIIGLMFSPSTVGCSNCDLMTPMNECRQEIINYTNAIGYVDFADNYQFDRVKSSFATIEGNIYIRFNNLVSSNKR